MLLEELVPYAISAVNGPGGTFVSDDDEDWEVALANAFWTGRLRGFFKEWRIADEEIVHVTDDDAVFPREVAQIIVLFAAMNVLESKLASVTTKNKAKAGPVESETQRSAQLLVELLRMRRKELEDIRDDLEGSSLVVGFVDLVLERVDAGGPTWLR